MEKILHDMEMATKVFFLCHKKNDGKEIFTQKDIGKATHLFG